MGRLPVALNALRAFEAVARHLSVKAAAEELGVTPSAISHQLRSLEDALGISLLRRAGAGLELTERGRALAPELTAAFDRIAGAVGSLRQERSSGPLRVSMLPTFATHWLSPRLASYPFGKAGFELLISATQDTVDLLAGAADAAVRHGGGAWPGLIADLLFAETVTLFGASSCWEAFRCQGRGADERELRARLAGANLFLSQHRKADFAAWNASLPGGPLDFAATTFVDSAGFGLRAAIDGAGVTLAGCEMAAKDVEAHRLVPLLGHRHTTGGGYFLVYPEALARDRRLRNLRSWLLAESAALRGA